MAIKQNPKAVVGITKEICYICKNEMKVGELFYVKYVEHFRLKTCCVICTEVNALLPFEELEEADEL